MSTCNTTTSATNCPCDDFVHPAALQIDAGLTELPRQIAGFPEFRRAMLRAISEYGPLTGWQAQKEEDLGVMLIEMWAYVCDVLAFYDGVIAHESYLGTAKLRPSVRKLVDMLGYLPKPATAATVQLAALASGRQPVTLPAGMAFKSKAFDAEPPQTFELDAETIIHPFANKFEIQRVSTTTLDESGPIMLTVLPLADLPVDGLVLVSNKNDTTQNSAHKIASQSRFQGEDGVVYTSIGLDVASSLTASALFVDLSLCKPSVVSKLWTRDGITGAYGFTGYDYSTLLYFDRVQDQIFAGDNVIVQIGTAYYAAHVYSIFEASKNPSGTNTITINGALFTMPSITVNVTGIWLDDNVALYYALQVVTDFSTVRVHHGMQVAANITREPDVTLVAGDALQFTKPVDQPLDAYNPSEFLLHDNNQNGQALSGGFNGSLDGLTIPDLSDWSQTLYAPVKAYGNVIAASRGETVLKEVLGSGNASSSGQQFKLKKKPLTYFQSATLDNAAGVSSTLVVYVDNVMWTEVSSFYLYGPEDKVYTVRQDDDHESYVIFGDGVKGSRLPTGSSNVFANYRFGAGAATPPAASILQIGKPVAGLQSILNPVAATPGADAEDADGIRSNGPQSILIMGRAVSIKDMEAVAATYAGVRVAQAEWRWSGKAQQALALIYYIGDIDEVTLATQLQNVTDGVTAIEVQAAMPRSIALTISVAYDPTYEPTALGAAIMAALTTDAVGFLEPEVQGIGQHFFRSQLFAAILAVPGTFAVQNVFWSEDGAAATSFDAYGKKQYTGYYWDFETIAPIINLYPESL